MIDSRWSLCLVLSTLALMAAPPAARACTGSANDPVHCINNNQAINGFGEFYSRNLQPLPAQSPDDSSDFAHPTYHDLAPRVGALPSGALRSNFALYADLDEGAASTEVHYSWPVAVDRADTTGNFISLEPPVVTGHGSLIFMDAESGSSSPDPLPAYTLEINQYEDVPTAPGVKLPGRRVGSATLWHGTGTRMGTSIIILELPDGKRVGVGRAGHVYGEVNTGPGGFGWRLDGPVTMPSEGTQEPFLQIR